MTRHGDQQVVVALVVGWIAGGAIPDRSAAADPDGENAATTAGPVQAPVLKWQYAGCYSSWCETGWYSSPAVADLDGDGATEIAVSAQLTDREAGYDGGVYILALNRDGTGTYGIIELGETISHRIIQLD